MILDVTNATCRVTEEANGELKWLDEYLSFENRQAFFSGGPPKDRMLGFAPDGAREFPTGYLPLVKMAAPEEGYRVQVRDARTAPCLPRADYDASWLRPYQVKGAAKATAAKRGILWVPTAGGKTEMAIALSEILPCLWLFLVHKKDLLEQAASRYEQRTGNPAGRVGDGAWTEERFTVATFQTLHRRLQDDRDGRASGLLLRAQGMFVDEAHRLPAASFTSVAARAENAYWRFGLSGTPLARGDKRSACAVGVLGPVIFRVRPEVLIKAGVLARPRIRFVQVHQYSPCPTWQGVYGECVVRSPRRNRAVVEAALAADKPCLVFVKEIGHGQRLLKALLKRGVKAEFTWGTHAAEQRRAAVKRLVRGDVDVLVCSTIFEEGVDIPSLAAVVVASGGRSAIAALQRVGRGMRSDGGKKAEFEVVDFWDTGNKMLERQSKARRKVYEAEGYPVAVTEAPGAWGLSP